MKSNIKFAVTICLLCTMFFSCRSVIDKIIPGKYVDPLKSGNSVLKVLGAKKQKFRIDNSKPVLLKGTEGTKIVIPANAFIDAEGTAVSGKVDITLVEVSDSTQFAGSNVPMEYDDALFVSNGMIQFEARQNNKVIGVRDDRKIIALLANAEANVDINDATTDTARSYYKKYSLDHHNDWKELNAPEIEAAHFKMKTNMQIIDLKDRTNGIFSTPSLNNIKKLYVTGTMNNWKLPGISMRKNDSGNWEIELDVSKAITFKYYSTELDEFVALLPEYHLHYIPGQFGQGGKLISQNYRFLFNDCVEIASVKLKKMFYYPLINLTIPEKNVFTINSKIIPQGKKIPEKLQIRNVFLSKTGATIGKLSINPFKEGKAFSVKSVTGIKSRVLVVDEFGNAGISGIVEGKGKKEITIPNIKLKKVPRKYMKSGKALSRYLKLNL